MEIIPAILPNDIQDIKKHLTEVMGISKWIQIDLCDGKFVESTTWPYNGEDALVFEKIMAEEEGLPYWDRFNFEGDLMVKDAHEKFDTFIKLGFGRIVFHLEAEGDIKDFSDFLEGIDMNTRDFIQIGVSIDERTDINEIKNFINYVDFIQVMGIGKIGVQGQEFDPKTITRVSEIKKLFPETKISIDGGVDTENAKLLKEAGADRLVVGSHIWNSGDIPKTIQEFENI